MATTLPVFTQEIDDDFVDSWYQIRPDAIDNILDAVVVWAALRDKGVFEEQVGGTFLEHDIKFGEESAEAVEKGDVLPSGEPDLETQALWTWRYCATHVQRSLFDDQRNSGPAKRKDYVKKRMKAAREAIEQKYETNLLQAAVLTETGKEIQGLNDLIPPFADRATGTYGRIARSNDFWQNKYKQISGDKEVTLISDMRNLYNTVHNNQEPPDLIISDQGLFELYEEFGVDAIQIVKNDNFLADLGFETLMFKGKDMIWTPNMIADNMLFLNTSYITLFFDPQLWFDMTEFKPIPLQGERIAHIISTMNLTGGQPRRHGRLFI